ncbi:diguanylate cyclase [Methylomonas methanica]|uniref:cyclic-guanylate-specific phosphodiesterase n=1 Tax=Methylomonas methanica TaxID=421 RepID=A0A177MHX7_METMH|nr:EAL domain-containing protein [Methylomonas methanica]OAI05407.1 diguanylate cyclase [Methylomonas methanica]
MTADEIPPTLETNAEIARLIDVLHSAGQRLEELTAGQVDTVADHTGRPFLLGGAQEYLRRSESDRQTAILNALPAHIALLDSQGRIISVNQAWRQFATENAFPYIGFGIGLNYLQICDSAQGEGAFDALRAASAIRSVLSGAVNSMSIEYACHSPTEQRWFLMTITPVGDGQPVGGVVMHMNVTEQKLNEARLLASELRFRQIAENIRDVIFLLDADSRCILYVSPAYEDIWGQSCESLYNDPGSWLAAMHPQDRAAGHGRYDKRKTPTVAGAYEDKYRIVRPDGTTRWIGVKTFPVFDDLGKIIRIAGVAEDITQRKEAETRILYLNRVLTMLSAINSLITRVSDRDELFSEASRIAVEAGGFRMSLIAIKDPSSMTPQPVASAGKDEALLTAVKGILASSEDAGKTMVARAIRDKIMVVSNDSLRDPLVVFGKMYAASGIRSLAVLPLIVADEALGVLVLYAGEIDFFQAEELKVLAELAEDIAFAIDHIAQQERLEYLTYFDVLTGLANHGLFLDRVTQLIGNANKGGQPLALVLVDLERFKSINDSLGRPAGDALLKLVGEWFTAYLGDVNLLARTGADHFALLLKIKPGDDLAQQVEQMMAAFLAHAFELDGAVFRIAIKIGVALYPDDASNAAGLFRNAEAALKKAKVLGDRYLLYTQKMTESIAGKLSLENQLRQALDNAEFVLHYQPKVNLVSGKLTSAEALIRWNDPRTGLVPPGRFIPVLEETGLINEVGRWAMSQALNDYLRWRNAGLPAVRIAVNVSPLQLRNRRFIAEVKQAISIDAHAAAGLELELTESLIMADINYSIASLQTLRAMGVSITIDDFGTGFSSLSYLSKLPVDTLKIDRSFVIEMTETPEGLALVSTIINLAHSMKLKVVAEGVETEEQSRLLRLLSCDEMQGFLFSKPVPSEIFETRFLSL